MKLLKKVSCFFAILSLCMIVGVCSNAIVASAASVTEDGLEYEVKDGGIIITGYEGEALDVTIPYEIYGYKVVAIESFAFDYSDGIKTVTILADLDSICSYAFVGCRTLEKVEVKGSVKRIGEEAFGRCYKLTTVKLTNGLEKINNFAFKECESLVTINLPKTLVEIGLGAFQYCDSLKSIDIPANVNRMAYYYAPMSVFWGCSNLTKINVASDNKTFTSVDGILYSKDMKTVYACPAAKTGNYSIPVGVTLIEEGAFLESNLTTLIIPEGVTKIRDEAFEYSKINKLVVPNSVSELGYGCFKNAENMVVYCAKGTYILEYALNNGVDVNVDSYLGNFKATIKQASFAYTGEYIKPVVTVKGTINGKTVTLENWKDYKVEYKNFKNPGTATITVTGRGKYIGTLSLTFTIRPVDLSKFSATIKQNTFTYTGEYIKPVVTVKGKVNGKEVTLANWKDYKITYKNFKNPGQATMTITGRGTYGGSKTITFYIRPTQVKNVKYVGKSTTYTNFKWDKCVGVTGYEVYRSTSKNGTYTKVGTVSTTSFKNTGLKKGTTYYYKVRAYKTVGSTKLYGAYSSVYTLATSK